MLNLVLMLIFLIAMGIFIITFFAWRGISKEMLKKLSPIKIDPFNPGAFHTVVLKEYKRKYGEDDLTHNMVKYIAISTFAGLVATIALLVLLKIW